MFVEDFFIKDIFPFQATIANWNDGDKVIVGLNAWLSFFDSITCFEIWYNLCYDINFGNCYRHLVLQWSGVQISYKVF